MVLDGIVAGKREEVARRKAASPGGLFDTLQRSDRSLEDALRRPQTGFILECKRSSPSGGLIRQDFDPDRIAAAYAPYADAISVLTDGPHFGGSFDDLTRVSRGVAQPVLCKDFIVDPWQVSEARYHGADAVLLMLSVLDDDAWRACAARAEDLAVDVLTEVHTEPELTRAVRLGARVIGINNRDLRTLAIDLDTVRKLAPLVPIDRVVVCESGIRGHDDVRSLRQRVNAFLVGSSLMEQPDLPAAVRRLIFGVNKVCGLTRPVDARIAEAAGATHGGLIFAEESPRRVTLEEAERVRNAAHLEWVGVFVNPAPEEVIGAATTLDLAAVQLHGEEPPDWIRALRERLPDGCRIWKAIRVRDRLPAVADTGADGLVLDGWTADRRGGTGKSFDWRLLPSYPERDRVFLGGGLTPEIVQAAAEFGTLGLDVNSGVESAPGRKDPARLAAYFSARRGRGRARTRKDD